MPTNKPLRGDLVYTNTGKIIAVTHDSTEPGSYLIQYDYSGNIEVEFRLGNAANGSSLYIDSSEIYFVVCNSSPVARTKRELTSPYSPSTLSNMTIGNLGFAQPLSCLNVNFIPVTPTPTPTPTVTPTPSITPTNSPTPSITPSSTSSISLLGSDPIFIVSSTAGTNNTLYRWNQESYSAQLILSEFPAGGDNRTYLDLAHTDTKMWRGGSTTGGNILEYNISLNPFTVTYNRIINLPSGFFAAQGLAVRNDGINDYLIVATGTTGTSQIYELIITGSTAEPVFKFSLTGGCHVLGDFYLSTNNKFVVNVRVEPSPYTYALLQYDYTTGSLELSAATTANFWKSQNSFWVSGSTLYLVRAGGNATTFPSLSYSALTTSPYTLPGGTLTGFWLGAAIQGISQVPSAYTTNFIVT